MKRQHEANGFRSFEQLKADLFPRLTIEERRQSSSYDSSKVGACLADEVMEEMLNNLNKSRK